MTIYFKGRWWTFRECDTEGKTEAEVVMLADKSGIIQYQPTGWIQTWLYVKGVGFGWETEGKATK